MRDFLPADVRKREYVIGIIKQVYESYGFEPLETPAVENIDTLMGKYGDEGNQLIFKILKRGEKLDEAIAERGTRNSELSDLALRYDLTVPLARVVANNRNELPKFFKRYQIQPVWRADRPAKGRFREFYQCDVDVMGSESPLVEAELCAAIAEVLERLGFFRQSYRTLLNHRNILFGLLTSFGVAEDKHLAAITIIDKTDKIGVEGVRTELAKTGISATSLKDYTQFVADLGKSSSNLDQNTPREVNELFLGELRNRLKDEKSSRAIRDVERILEFSDAGPAKDAILISPWLARGLSYYTGAILEVVNYEGNFRSSLAGGGRYDGLIGMFGKEQIPACGFSLGLERILVVMDERGMFPPEIAESSAADVLVTIWSPETKVQSLQLAQELRSTGLRVTLYPEPDKLGKQIKYADSIKVPFVAVLGESEIADGTVTVKNMKTGDQQTLSRADAGGLAARLIHAS